MRGGHRLPNGSTGYSGWNGSTGLLGDHSTSIEHAGIASIVFHNIIVLGWVHLMLLVEADPLDPLHPLYPVEPLGRRTPLGTSRLTILADLLIC